MASYAVNKRAVAHARDLIDAKQYVLESDWSDAQPKADDENDFLETHSWDEYRAGTSGSPRARPTRRRPGTHSCTATFDACTDRD